jgi:hypothetical protein
MQRINYCTSDLTGKLEQCSICPELRSDDGQLICDGIADVDVMDMFDWGVDKSGRIAPIDLLSVDRSHRKDTRQLVDGARPMVQQAQQKMLKSWARKSHKKQKDTDHKDRYKELIQKFANVSMAEMHRIPETSEDVAEIVQQEPRFVLGLMKLLDKMQDDELKENGE